MDFENPKVNVDHQKALFVIHTKTLKNKQDVGENNFLFSSALLDYQEENIQLKFVNHCFKWNLQKFRVFYNSNLIQEKALNQTSDGLKYLFTINFVLSIKDLQIQYYSNSDKNFKFELEYFFVSHYSKDQYRSTFELELPKIHGNRVFKFVKLDIYMPGDVIKSLFDNDFKVGDKSSTQELKISQELQKHSKARPEDRFLNGDYVKIFKTLLDIEDLTDKKALKEFELTNQRVHKIYRSHQYFIWLPIKLPGNLGLNHICLTTMDLYEKHKQDLSKIESQRICNQITRMDDNVCVFEKKCRWSRVSIDCLYHVEFLENRIPMRVANTTLDMVKAMNLEEFFCKFEVSSLKKQEKVEPLDENNNLVIEWSSDKTNERQKIAITNIINKSSHPLPYLIFGPPGTGKTSTLVEAVIQILKLRPYSRILISAQSNSACDEIGVRLLKQIPRYKFYRFYSPSFERPEKIEKLHPLLKPFSNLKSNRNVFPTYQALESYNVVISTLVNCGRLITANFKRSHFSYIFIDEAACTTEPATLIPLVGLGAELDKINATIVLVGDHKQLGPLIKSPFNDRLGLSCSLMERMMLTIPIYQEYPYNSQFVTQLVENYRSHESILHFSNVQFYHRELVAKQTPEIANFACGWKFLPNKDFPVLFHSILKPSEMLETSLFNDEEIQVVARYVRELLFYGINGKGVIEQDIAIICPYKAQRDKFIQTFKCKPGIEIGTVDYYQGREKKIIILSTVRSQTQTIGFLRNEKRLNVALTRAKSLLIVVGNAETLQRNKLWYKFINFCHKHDSLVGEKFMLRYRKSKYNEIVLEEQQQINCNQALETVMEDEEDDFLEAQAEREALPQVKLEQVALKHEFAAGCTKDLNSEDSESDFDETWYEDDHEDDGIACRATKMFQNRPEKKINYSPTKIRMEKFKLISRASTSSSSDCHFTDSDLNGSFYEDYESISEMESVERSLLFLEDFGDSDSSLIYENPKSDSSKNYFFSNCCEDFDFDSFVKKLMAIELDDQE